MKIGTKVMLVVPVQKFNGLTGIIVDREDSNYYVRLDKSSKNGCSGYNLVCKEDQLCPMKDTKLLRVCSCCGGKNIVENMIYGKNKKYICLSCNDIQPYSTKNDLKFHKKKKHGKTYGFEFECIPNSIQDKVVLCDRKYSFIPTYDASLPKDGIEFKTPIYYSLNGIKPMLKTLTTCADFTHVDCGQHINIGDTKYINCKNMCKIRDYSPIIFTPLAMYLKENRESTVKICGRYFTDYATISSYTDHYSWINLSHDNRIEFRLSKMQTPTQYFQLICMWTEMLDAIITWFLPNPSYKSAQKTSEKLVKIFQKYENEKANCQRPERNSI